MAVEISCTGNDEVKLQCNSDADSTFTISTPYSFNTMEDCSYGVVEKIDLVEDTETGLKSLSGTGYEFRFPYSTYSESITTNNSIGWFNSWGAEQGSISYTMGQTWSYTLAASADILSFKDCSATCGAADGNSIYFSESDKTFYVRDNNSFFDYILNGPNYDFLKVRQVQKEDDVTCYLQSIEQEDLTDGYNKLYGLSLTENELFYTPTDLESTLKIDINSRVSYYRSNTKKDKLAWRIYGSYYFNGKLYDFKSNTSLQSSINAYLLNTPLKQEFSSFKDVLRAAIENATDIQFANIKFANLFLVELGDDGKTEKKNGKTYIIADMLAIKCKEVELPAELAVGESLLFSTPNCASKPQFLMNGTFLIDFPCYKYFGESIINNVYEQNFTYDSLSNTTRFDLVLEGIIPGDLSISCATKLDWKVIGAKTLFIVPPIYDYDKSYSKCYNRYAVDVTNSAFGSYPVNLSQTPNILRLTPTGNTLVGKDWGNYSKILTLGSRYPMTPNGAIRFSTKTVYTIEVAGSTVDHEFTISSSKLSSNLTETVLYTGLTSAVSVTKLSNNTSRALGSIVLQPYMYDATSLSFSYKLSNNEELSFSNSDITITVSDNTSYNKTYDDISLADIVNGDFSDLIFSNGLVKNELNGTYELTIYMAAYCTDEQFSGKGFNDSIVSVRFNVHDEYRKKYNIDSSTYCASYITTLPPYMIQGTPFTKEPELEEVLNSEVSPQNASARTDYNYYSYSNNAYGYTEDNLFTNAAPMYYCVASAFVPSDFNGTLSGVEVKFVDSWTNQECDVNYVSAAGGKRDLLVLTSGNSTGYMPSTTEYSAFGSFKLWTFEQELDIPTVKARGGIMSNMLKISAHLDYSTIDESAESENMVVIRSNI